MGECLVLWNQSDRVRSIRTADNAKSVQITALKAAESCDFGAIVAKAKTSLSAVERRAEELDTIASVLPMERRDELAELLTDQDVETLKHLVNQCMGDDTLRALTSPSLSRSLGTGRDRTVPALAGGRSAAAEMRRAPSVGSGETCGRYGSRHACRRRQQPPAPGLSEIHRPACTGYCAPPVSQLVDPHEMASASRRLCLSCA